jgi:hypothetical protein
MIVEDLQRNTNIQVCVHHNMRASDERNAHKSSARTTTTTTTTTTTHRHAPTTRMMPLWHHYRCCCMPNGTQITAKNQDLLHQLPTKTGTKFTSNSTIIAISCWPSSVWGGRTRAGCHPPRTALKPPSCGPSSMSITVLLLVILPGHLPCL